MAWLVRSTGNAVHATFLADGDPAAKAQKLLGRADDGQPNPNSQVILYSPVWPESP